ncbi:MAG: hypothetical protein KFB93_07955 [Simkaniaceae bacterium]|nr:MAG: hypothetical protein KFB93_07955 [Simkaniaceae bacterium]
MKFLSNVFYILCLPSFLLSPIPAFSFQTAPSIQETAWDVPIDEFGSVNPWVLLRGENLSIDRYFSFIDLASNETFLKTLSEEEFDRVVEFMTTMLRLSAPESDEALVEAWDQDIEELLDDLYGDPKWKILCSNGFDFEFAPAVFYANSFPEIFLCKKNWVQRKAHHFGHWCSKHKKPLIVGAVVVGVVAIAAITGGVGGSSAVAVGGALINDTYSGEDRPKHINKPGEVYVDDGSSEPTLSPPYHPTTESIPIPSSQPTPLEQAHALSFEKVENAKLEIAEQTQNIAEAPEKKYIEKAKDVTKITVSNIVHDVFESISKIGTTWHEIHTNSTPEDAQVYKEFVAAQHEKIDEIFGTYRPDYSLESQEYAAAYKAAIIEELGYYPEMQIGELPPPGALISAVSRAATAASRAIGIAAKSGSAIGTAAVTSVLSKPTSPQSPSLGNSSFDVEATSKQLSKFRKQLQIDGKSSLDKSKISIQKRLDEHLIKLDKYKQEGGYTSSVEREIKNFQQELQAIDIVLEEANG